MHRHAVHGAAQARASPSRSPRAPVATTAGGLSIPTAGEHGAGALSSPSHVHSGLNRNASNPSLVALASASAAAAAVAAPAAESGFSSAALIELADYIAGGPLLASCSISADSVHAHIGEWARLGKQLALQLGFNPVALDDVQKLRIYRYYLPIYFWAQSQLDAHKKAGHNTALVLGISAPQGCGKSTVVEQLEQLFNWLGHRAAAVSIDDFYLTYEDQTALGAANPDNALLQMRGNAGSHDLALGTAALQSLRGLTAPGSQFAVPRYNKSAYSGRGDRADQSTWPVVQGPLDIVFFEGWMSGFAPVADEEAAKVDPALVKVNQLLRTYKAAWDSLVDSWLVIRIGDPQWVFKWRLQAEEKMKASGKAGMSEAQIADFVARFMPAYKAYLPGLYAAGPTTARAGSTLIIEVDEARAPVAKQPAPVV